MGFGDFARSLRPGRDAALAAELRQKEEQKEKARKAKEQAERVKRARAHKQRLARKGSGARLI